MVSLMPAFPDSSVGRFSVPSKAADKGNGKNLAARSPQLQTTRSFIAARFPERRSPLVGDSR